MPHATEWQGYSVVSGDEYWNQRRPAKVLINGEKERCQISGCDRKVARWPINDGEYWYSPYWCKHHVCHVGPDRCANSKRSKDLYCRDHSYCAARGCPAQPTSRDLSRRDLPWYCSDHCCKHENRHGEQCVKPCIPGSSHCEHHYRRRVHKEPQDETISIRCRVQNCTYQRSSGSWYCTVHKCTQCEELATYEGVCGHHRVKACSVQGCDHPREVTAKNEVRDFCCYHKRCTNSKNGCKAIILSDRDYCDAHVCCVPTCERGRYQAVKGENAYCQLHTCIEERCTNPTSKVDDDRFQRCIYHTCGVSGCYHRSTVLKGYCLNHCCDVQGCNNGITGRHSYCTEHECKESDCYSLVKHPHGYCEERRHACSKKNCAARAGDIDYPDLCPEHARELLRKEGHDEGRKSLEAELEEQRWRAAMLQDQLDDYYLWSGSSTSGSSRDRRKRDKDDKKYYEWERRHRREHSHERRSDSRSISSGTLSNGYRYVTITKKH